MAPSPNFNASDLYQSMDFDKAIAQLEKYILAQQMEKEMEKDLARSQQVKKDLNCSPRSHRSAYVADAIRRTVSNVMSSSVSLSFDQYSVDGTFQSVETVEGTPMHSTPRQSTTCFRRLEIDDSRVSCTTFMWCDDAPVTPSSPGSYTEENTTIVKLNLTFQPASHHVPVGQALSLPDTPCLWDCQDSVTSACFPSLPACLVPHRRRSYCVNKPRSLCKRLRKFGRKVCRRLNLRETA